jgi:3-carboxy-cis,cis-muconate cycloisomerase
MASQLIECLVTTASLTEIFSDDALLQAMLDFESALARAEAAAGVIPLDAAAAITAAACPQYYDGKAIANHARRSGTVAIPLVEALAAQVGAADPRSADFVHWGTTSQDVADTALVLLLKRARPVLAADQLRLERALYRLSEDHAGSVMLARTLLQPAPPVTFGLKAAAWRAAAQRGWQHVEHAFEETLVLQFGGASGTLAALAGDGLEVSRLLARELGLRLPDAPWHAHRDRFATLVSSLGVYVGSLAKMARDITLLMQPEVGEVCEGAPGGSSTMPHKRNPTRCSLALAAAARLPGLVATLLAGMVQEHERAAGTWQAEWPCVSAAVQAAGMVSESMAEVAEGLRVDRARMRRNIESVGGSIFSERAMIVLRRTLGREEADRILSEATQQRLSSGQSFSSILAAIPGAGPVPPDLEKPESYLGSAEQLRRQLLKDQE